MVEILKYLGAKNHIKAVRCERQRLATCNDVDEFCSLEVTGDVVRQSILKKRTVGLVASTHIQHRQPLSRTESLNPPGEDDSPRLQDQKVGVGERWIEAILGTPHEFSGGIWGHGTFSQGDSERPRSLRQARGVCP